MADDQLARFLEMQRYLLWLWTVITDPRTPAVIRAVGEAEAARRRAIELVEGTIEGGPDAAW